jgi:7-cyano-7-deazaguanine reductase
MRPKYLEVIGEFTPRGGISIFPFSSYAKKEKKFQDLKKRRFEDYAPGKYTMSLARIYT